MSKIQSDAMKEAWGKVSEDDRKQIMAQVREHLPRKGEMPEETKERISKTMRDRMTPERRERYRQGALKRYERERTSRSAEALPKFVRTIPPLKEQ